MFQNFVLHRDERPYAGVDLSPDSRSRLARLGLPSLPQTLRWARLVFGWNSAPFYAVSMMMRAVELAKRAPWDRTSEFRVDRVVLNLPGSAAYDPTLPRVRLLRVDGSIATDLVIFMDDGRAFAATIARAATGMRQISSSIQQRGIQDAARKRVLGGQRARAWTGGVVRTDKGSTRKFVVTAKWFKLKTFVLEVHTAKRNFPRSRFESGLGFLCTCPRFMSFSNLT
jgi:hypothetical protein